MLTEIDFKNPRHELYPGMYANVTLELERHRDASSYPSLRSAIRPMEST